VDSLPITTVIGLLAFIAGGAFGAVANRTNFCTMGAISDWVLMGDLRRMRAWMLAIAVAMVGTHALHASSLIDVDESIYRSADFGWFGAVLGGLMFGFGMTLAGGCGNKTLVRIGTGNLKSVYVFLVLGIAAYATLRGLTGVARIELETLTNVDLASMGYASQGMEEFLAAASGLSAQALRWMLTAILAGGLAIWCFTSGAFRSSPRDVFAGFGIGTLIPVGWAITGIAGADDFDPQPLASFTFVAPIGESIQYLMTFTGSTIGFGVAAVGGVIFGSLLTAIVTRSFHVEGFGDKSDMVRHTIGAGLMGIGGVLALGCTVGQGLSGMSTLALGSLIATISIVAGGVLGMKYLEEGSLGGALKAVAGRA
jgi:uncharacterized membrane protein YedE/YeeE